MHLTLVINSVLCVFGVAGGVMLAIGSIISIANMRVPWVTLLLVAAPLVPVMYLVSGIGSWLAYRWHHPHAAAALVALPWVYAAGFILAMLASFDQ